MFGPEEDEDDLWDLEDDEAYVDEGEDEVDPFDDDDDDCEEDSGV